MKEKIILLREMEDELGLVKFKITKNTTEIEIDNVLHFINSSFQTYKDKYKSKVVKFINNEK